jgi:polyisoprenoid-binding protein YceI
MDGILRLIDIHGKDSVMTTSPDQEAATLQAQLGDGTLAGDWTLDPARSTVAFASKSVWGLVGVKGAFREIEGTGTVAPDGKVTGSVNLVAESLDTKNAKRDKHLRSDDFFMTEKYSAITFTAGDFTPDGAGVTVSGTLTVRDHSQPISFPATVTLGDDGTVTFDGTAHVDRSEYGITWNQMGMASMKNVITVHAVLTRSQG